MSFYTTIDPANLRRVETFRRTKSSAGCTRCPLWANHINPQYPVISRGTGRIMLVGISPTWDEHSIGEPMSGLVGGWMKVLFANIDLDLTEDCYLTNIMRCRPNPERPNGFTSYKKPHIQACSYHLAREIQPDMVDPVIIVFFGRDVFEKACGEKNPEFIKLGHPIGVPFQTTVYTRRDQWVMVMNNPAIIFRDSRKEVQLRAHVSALQLWISDNTDIYDRKMSKFAKADKDPGSDPLKADTETFLIDTKEKLRELAKEVIANYKAGTQFYMALDTETSDKNIHSTSFFPVGVSVAFDNKKGYYLPFGHRRHSGLYALGQGPVTQLTQEDVVAFLKYMIDTLGLKPVFHHYYYDSRVLAFMGYDLKHLINSDAEERLHDTYHLVTLSDENQPKSLKERTLVDTGKLPGKFRWPDFSYVDPTEATKYAGDDAVNTFRLLDIYAADIKHQSMARRTTGDETAKGLLWESVYRDELTFTEITADMTTVGIRVDYEAALELRQQLLEDEEEVLRNLYAISRLIKPNSPYQLSALLRDLVVREEDRSEFEIEYNWSVDEDHLNLMKSFIRNKVEDYALETGMPFDMVYPDIIKWHPDTLDKYLDLVLDLRRLDKARSSFIEAILAEAIEEEPGLWIIHTNFGVPTTSGRMTSRDPNLQQSPRETIKAPSKCRHCENESAEEGTWWNRKDKFGRRYTCRECGKITKNFAIDVRALFIPREGNVFVSADWSSMELTVAAVLSGDSKLLSIVIGQQEEPDNPEYDPHRVTAAGLKSFKTGKTVLPADVTKDERQDAKPVNFGALYGIAALGLQANLRSQGVNVTADEAKEILDNFFKLYPGLKAWFRACEEQLMKEGWIATPWGRLRHMPDKPTGKDIRSGINFVIQGWCAQIMKRAAIKVNKELRDLTAKFIEDGFVAFLCLIVHDELVTECSVELAETVAEILRVTMTQKIKDKGEATLVAEPEIKNSLSKSPDAIIKVGE